MDSNINESPKLQRLYLVRHGRSEFNEAFAKANEKLGILKEELFEDDYNVRFSEELFDSSLTAEGRQQVNKEKNVQKNFLKT